MINKSFLPPKQWILFSNQPRMGKYCGTGYLDMCYSVGLGLEGFVAQHLIKYVVDISCCLPEK